MATAKKQEVMASQDNMPAYMKDKMMDQRGNENVGTDDVQLPRIDVLQALSPQIKKSDPDYIDGAEQGMLFNTLTGDLYEELQFIPVYVRKRWLLWKDRKAGGGLRGVADSEAEAKAKLAELDDRDQVEIVDTHENIVLIVEKDGTLTEAIWSLAKSKAKVARKFNSLVRLNGGPRFSRVYTMLPFEDENAAGEAYWNMAIGKSTQWPTQEQFEYAEALYESISQGSRKVGADYTEEAPAADGDVEASEI
ncbi:hypothetical protein [Zhongshania sp.]|uniref:hypothetical protein n=1 Tax=Zhongshania sp. TaxID=1971902 RepID=UPI003566DC58